LHDGFRLLTDGESAIGRLCSTLFGEESVLFKVCVWCLCVHVALKLMHIITMKEKLNYKPAGGAGFMPHLDFPSLSFYAPPTMDDFITVMIAIDDMTEGIVLFAKFAKLANQNDFAKIMAVCVFVAVNGHALIVCLVYHQKGIQKWGVVLVRLSPLQLQRCSGKV
jgi:hypothetical protein